MILVLCNVVKSKSGGYMVAFAGRKYAARSLPEFVADTNYIVTGFTMVKSQFRSGLLIF